MPITQRIDGDIDFLDLHELHPTRYPYLLQTVARQQSEQVSYDILFACPRDTLVLIDGELTHNDSREANADGANLKAIPCRSNSSGGSSSNENPSNKNLLNETSSKNSQSKNSQSKNGSNFLAAFDQYWRAESVTNNEAPGLPFSGGWFVFLGYELAGQIEPTLVLPATDAADLPTAFATRIPAAIIKNNSNNDVHIVVEQQYAACVQTIATDVRQCQANAAKKMTPHLPNVSIIECIHEEDADRYLQSVQQIKRYIKDGDVFQVNLSRLWQARLKPEVSTADIYRRLRISNPAPFFALATYRQQAIISSSPERLVCVNNGVIQTRPIAGTRPRGGSKHADAENLNELIAHPKERAEHIMLIDLERNDIGRVSVPGTVTVNELMVLESYAHVHHIVSNIRGQLPANTSPSDIVSAVFPGGTITGCPKVRCMEILAELEQSPRGAYTGSLGYINHDGSMDLNILIRTLVKNGRAINLRAGGGIVADSVADKELQETRVKAKGLLLALDGAADEKHNQPHNQPPSV